MASDYPSSRKSNTIILQELEDLSESLYQSHLSSTTTRRTASLVLPRASVPPISSDPDEIGADKDAANLNLNLNPKPRSRRLSLSPWRSRPKMETEEILYKDPIKSQKSLFNDEKPATEKKGIWKWKPIRALTHIGMQKLSCLFSVEVVAAQGLPASMNGLRLSVCVRKKDSREGGVQTMPSRVSQGAADFEETLFIRSHVYFTPASGGTPMKFEPRPFLIYLAAVDASELDFGKKTVDLSGLIQESIDKNLQGTRIRQWDTTCSLSGKAKGGELVLKLGFQIMEKDGGVGIYSQADGQKSGKKATNSPSVGRNQSKSSFSVPSPRMTSWLTPSQKGAGSEDLAMDALNLDEPAPQPPPPPPIQKHEEVEVEVEVEAKDDNDNDMLDFEVEDKGVEIQDEEEHSEENSEKRSNSSEVVKEVVQDQYHVTRLTELDSIAQQIKALESMMGDEKALKNDEETSSSQALDADEDKVTREFLQMLEVGDDDNDDDDSKFVDAQMQPPKLNTYEDAGEGEAEVFLPDLGKGLGCVVQTRNGGYLAAANPFNAVVGRKETPKLAMQLSKPMVIQSDKTGFEVFQKMAALGLEELASELLSSMVLDELSGKTAEQIAFEGIANAIIQGRTNKEGATSSAARTIAAVKSMATMMSSGRRERVSSGIWNVSEEPVTADYILAFSLQKIEDMAVEALKIQANISEEEAPFEVSPLDPKTTAPNGKVFDHVLASASGIEEWINTNSLGEAGFGDPETITVAVLVQLRDPIRQFEAVGGPMLALMHAAGCNEKSQEERMFNVSSLQVGGLKVRSAGIRTGWDTEKQRLTALQWLVAYGLGKAGKKGKRVASKGNDTLWSISSRIMADMWLKPIRNPDVKFNTK